MKQFRDVIGHKAVIEHLQKAIRHQTAAHAYLFEGDEGCGKRLMANIFAAALQCEEGGTEPCGKCRSCLQMHTGNHPDVRYVTHEKSMISVNDIRTQLCNAITIKPYQGPRSIYIVDEAEKMNTEAQNALLKTLEEPPAYGVIILITCNRNALLETIMSRVVTLSFMPVSEAEILPFLMTEAKVPDYQARLAAAFSGGCPGRALSLVTSQEFLARRDYVVGLMQELPDRTPERRAVIAKELAAKKTEIDAILDLCLMWQRDVLLAKAEGENARFFYASEKPALCRQAKAASYEKLERQMAEYDLLKRKRAANVNPEIAIWQYLMSF